jgi:hypothetical protein
LYKEVRLARHLRVGSGAFAATAEASLDCASLPTELAVHMFSSLEAVEHIFGTSGMGGGCAAEVEGLGPGVCVIAALVDVDVDLVVIWDVEDTGLTLETMEPILDDFGDTVDS